MTTRRRYMRSKIPPKKSPVDGRAIHWIIRWVWKQMNQDEWSQEDLAARAGVASTTMRRWRRGDRSPRFSELEAVVNALGFEIKLKQKEY